ncbi:sigma-70 family RNA polymerase sigma factor [Mariniluteicoccus flavus]
MTHDASPARDTPDDDPPAAFPVDAIVASLPLADAIARRYHRRGIDPDDLTQVARLGLVKAVLRFRPDAGESFEAYAVPTITGELRRHFRDHLTLVRPPRAVQELRAETVRVREVLTQRLGRPATDGDVAAELGVPVSRVREAAVARSEEYAELADLPDLDDHYGAVLDRRAVTDAVAQLDLLERELLQLRFVAELSQSEIAQRTGVSQMQVSRQLARTLRRLRSLVDDGEGEGRPRSRRPSAAP